MKEDTTVYGQVITLSKISFAQEQCLDRVYTFARFQTNTDIPKPLTKFEIEYMTS